MFKMNVGIYNTCTFIPSRLTTTTTVCTCILCPLSSMYIFRPSNLWLLNPGLLLQEAARKYSDNSDRTSLINSKMSVKYGSVQQKGNCTQLYSTCACACTIEYYLMYMYVWDYYRSTASRLLDMLG